MSKGVGNVQSAKQGVKLGKICWRQLGIIELCVI